MAWKGFCEATFGDLNTNRHRERDVSNMEVIQRSVLAALGHVKIDYRSPKRLDEAAKVIAEFVIAEMDRDRIENCKHPRKRGGGSVGCDGSSTMDWFCPDCGKSEHMETPPRQQQTLTQW